MASSSQISFHRCRSSAASIESGDVPATSSARDQAGELQRGLPAERNDHPIGALGREDVQHVLGGERFEVEPVGRVVVGRHGLGVAVDHHRLEAGIAKRERSVDAAVVELDALSDPVRAGPEDHDLLAIAVADLALVLVRRVVIRRLGGELGGARVDRLVRGDHAGRFTGSPHVALVDTPQIRQLDVGETEPLRPAPVAARHRGGLLVGERVPLLDDQRDLVEEPRVDPGHRVHDLDAEAAPQKLADLQQPVGGGDRRRGEQIVVAERVELRFRRVAVEAGPALFKRAQCLLEALGERAADRHDLADRLHLGAEHPGGAGQFLEGPAGDLGDHVVDHRLERGRCRSLGGGRDVVGDLVEGVADGEPGGDLGDREAGRFRRQRRRPRDARVHLDHDLATGLRVDGELHVRAAGLHTDTADAGDRCITHLLVLDVGERLDRGDGDRVTGVHAHRVDVLDAADDHAVVRVVTHHLELVLLPAGDRLLDEDLVDRAGGEPGGGEAGELLGRGRDAGPPAAEDVGGTDDHRQSDALDDRLGLLERTGCARPRHLEADLDHRLLEQRPVLGRGNGLGVGADHLRRTGHSDQAPLEQFHGDVQAGLPAEGRQHRVGALALDDRRQHLPGERLDVRGIGEIGIGHDRRRVRVGENDAVTLFLQHPARLGAGVVELAGLPDHDRARTDDQDRVDVVAPRHQRAPFRVIISANWSNR